MAKTIEELKKNIKEAIEILDKRNTCNNIRDCKGVVCDECPYKVNDDDYNKAYWLRERSLKAWSEVIDEIDKADEDLDGYDPYALTTYESRVDDIITKHLSEVNI